MKFNSNHRLNLIYWIIFIGGLLSLAAGYFFAFLGSTLILPALGFLIDSKAYPKLVKVWSRLDESEVQVLYPAVKISIGDLLLIATL